MDLAEFWIPRIGEVFNSATEIIECPSYTDVVLQSNAIYNNFKSVRIVIDYCVDEKDPEECASLNDTRAFLGRSNLFFLKSETQIDMNNVTQPIQSRKKIEFPALR